MNRQAVLPAIFATFATWCESSSWACTKGCSSCCTQNVTITSLEGAAIIDGLAAEDRLDWLWDTLLRPHAPCRPRYTFNTMARACLAGKTLPGEEPQPRSGPCPFLQHSCCTIYPLRPFSCRSFLSRSICSPDRPATVDEAHLAAATAVGQLLEHLSQGQAWGNMLDVLPFLLDRKGSAAPSHHLLRAQPLPGFLLGPEEYATVAPLLEGIFTTRVGDRTIEEILNGA